MTGSFLSCWRKGFPVKESCGPLGGPATREADVNTPGQYRCSCTLAERFLSRAYRSSQGAKNSATHLSTKQVK